MGIQYWTSGARMWVGIGLQPGLEEGDGLLEALLHGDGEGEIELDAGLLGVLGEAADELAHLDLGVFEQLAVDEGFGAQEGDGGHVGPLVLVDADFLFLLDPGGWRRAAGASSAEVEHALGVVGLDDVASLASFFFLAQPPRRLALARRSSWRRRSNCWSMEVPLGRTVEPP
jgi:hypothetical protein